jgi:hypothetical protein
MTMTFAGFNFAPEKKPGKVAEAKRRFFERPSSRFPNSPDARTLKSRGRSL